MNNLACNIKATDFLTRYILKSERAYFSINDNSLEIIDKIIILYLFCDIFN